jgi:hypothetical protein
MLIGLRVLFLTRRRESSLEEDSGQSHLFGAKGAGLCLAWGIAPGNFKTEGKKR